MGNHASSTVEGLTGAAATSQCAATSSATVLFINVLLHAAVVFLFLSVFYATIGSTTESRETNKQFSSIITKNVSSVLNEANTKSGGVVRTALKPTEPILDMLERRYARPNEARETHNRWLFGTAIGGSIAAVVAIVVVLLLLKLSCGQCPSHFLWGMIAQAAAIFIVVAGVEYYFFKNIALKTIPAPPSVMVNGIIDGIRERVL